MTLSEKERRWSEDWRNAACPGRDGFPGAEHVFERATKGSWANRKFGIAPETRYCVFCFAVDREEAEEAAANADDLYCSFCGHLGDECCCEPCRRSCCRGRD